MYVKKEHVMPPVSKENAIPITIQGKIYYNNITNIFIYQC